MELWSKGLGKRVLGLSLGERDGTACTEERLEMRGIMRAPVYWDYEVTLETDDVVGFLTMLQKPDAVRFLATSGKRGRMLGTALLSACVFLGHTLRLLVSPASRTHGRGAPDGT